MPFRIDERQLNLFSNVNLGENEPDSIDDVAFDEEDDPTTEFIRYELKRLEQSRRGALFDLQKSSGIGGGYISKIKNDDARAMHIGMTFVRKIAPALGYKDMGEFFLAIGKWWEESGRAMATQYRNPNVIADPELRVAVEMAKGFASRDVVQKVIAEYPKQIGTRDRWWWIEEMKREAKEEFQLLGESVTEKKKRSAQRRDLSDARREAPASSTSIADTPPSSEVPQQVVRPKRRAR
jgi:hypothetical protein